MPQNSDIKKITKESKLENIFVGEKIKIVGIEDPRQNHYALVRFYDPIAKLILVFYRYNEGIQVDTYFVTPKGIKKRQSRYVSQEDIDFPNMHKKLTEEKL